MNLQGSIDRSGAVAVESVFLRGVAPAPNFYPVLHPQKPSGHGSWSIINEAKLLHLARQV